MLKETYTPRELAPLLGISVRGVHDRADREGWDPLPRTGRGGGFAFPVDKMPQTTRATLAAALVENGSLPAVPGMTVPAIAEEKPQLTALKDCTHKQRETALARLVFVREVERLAALVGKEAAVMQIVRSSQESKLAAHLAELVGKANDKFADGKQRGLSRRRLYAWCSDYAAKGEAGLVPLKKGPDMGIPAWVPCLLKHFQRPQKPSLTSAYNDFCKEYTAQGENPPSYFAVRRWLQKMALPELENGRKTGNALLKLKPHKRRGTEDLLPGDVYTADGTTFDAEIAHPDHGSPFKPEVTAVIDVATRRCVGMSLGLAESALTILDALRMACLFGGIPALLYSDNGSGYHNQLLEGPGIGMLARLGIEPTNSIPGRPQGKGLMERAVQTLCEPVSKRMPTCTHADMDTDVSKKVFKLTRAHIKQGIKSSLLPTWGEFKTAILARVEEYNSTPHRALPMIVTEQGKRRHMSPDEAWQSHLSKGWEPVLVPEDVRDDLFMPSERRKVHNGMITFYKGIYYAPELADWHGDMVEVRYDIWDSSYVQVYTMQGQKVCKAELDGNKIPYFPQIRIEAVRESRQKAQLLRLESKAQRVLPGARLELPEPETVFTVADAFAMPQKALEVEKIVVELPPVEAKPLRIEPERRPLFTSSFQKYEWLLTHKEQWTRVDRDWMDEYITGEEYKEFQDYYAARGLAWIETLNTLGALNA